MKVLFFSSYFYPYISGLTTYPLKILSHLANKNKVTVLTFLYKKNLKAKEIVQKIETIRMPYLFKLSKGYIAPQAIGYFFTRAQKTDAVILNIPNFEGLALAFFAKLFGKKIICIFHCEVLLTGNLVQRIINWFLNTSVFFQLFLSDTIVAYTKDYVDHLWMGRFFRNKIRIVLPPVEILPVDQKKLDFMQKMKKDSVWIGFAGRVAKEKGLEVLVESLHLMRASGYKITLVLAGPYGEDVAGEADYYNTIKLSLEKNNIDYHLFGNLSDGNLGSFYKTIDLLVLPSINKTEAFGMVQVDAMLLGTPVIASNLPGVRVPIQLARMGKIVEPGNSQELASTLSVVLKNKSDYANPQLVKKAREIFASKKTYQFYGKLLSE